MINSIETVGLRVNSSTPRKYETGVDVHSTVEIEFNSELDTGSIYGNVFVLKDTNRTFVDNSTIINVDDYEVVQGSLTYRDRVIIFKALGQLDSSARYILYVPKGSIKDFKGRVSPIDFVSFFDTDGFQSNSPCNVIYPINNTTVSSLDRIELEDVDADSYIVQISKNKSFDNAVYDKVVAKSNIEQEFDLGDGSYYIRARATNGVFGDVSFFTIRSIPDTLVSDEDEPFFYQPFEDDNDITLNEVFPKGINVHEKTNLSYMEFDGMIDLNDIDFFESGMFEKGIEDESYENDPIDGAFIVTYDKENNKTYVAFIPEII